MVSAQIFNNCFILQLRRAVGPEPMRGTLVEGLEHSLVGTPSSESKKYHAEIMTHSFSPRGNSE